MFIFRIIIVLCLQVRIRYCFIGWKSSPFPKENGNVNYYSFEVNI